MFSGFAGVAQPASAVDRAWVDQPDQAQRLGCLALRHDWARAAIESFLSSPSPRLRSRAAPALSALAGAHPSAIESLARMASDPDPGVREAAGYWLARVCAGNGHALGAVKSALAADPAVRTGVAQGIGDAKECASGAFDVLVLLGCDDDGRVRARAAEALGAVATGRPGRAVRWLDDLLFFCRHSDEYINQGAALALARLLGRQAPGALKLVARLAEDGSHPRRWCAARALAGMAKPACGKSKRLLGLLARDPNPLVRAEVAMTAGALTRVDAEAMCEVIEGSASDRDGVVRGAAAQAMGLAAAARPEWALEKLAEFLAAQDNHLRLGAAAGLALAADRGQQVGAALGALARDKWALVRAAAAAALSRAWGESRQARKALLALALDANPEVRAAVASALAAEAGQPAGEAQVWSALDALRRDEFILVRRNAIATIGRLAAGDPARALAMLAAHIEHAPELAGLAPALARALAAHGENRLQAIISVALAARHESLLRGIAEAARDHLSADLMDTLHNLTRAEPVEEHFSRLADLVEAQEPHPATKPLRDAVLSIDGMLRARTLPELAAACARLPETRDFVTWMSFAPNFELDNPFAALVGHVRDASSSTSRQEKIAHLDRALDVIRANRAAVTASPWLLYRSVGGRLLAVMAAVLTTMLGSLRDEAELRVELPPALMLPTASEATLALHLHNEGKAPALNVRVRAQAQPPYAVALLATVALPELAPDERVVVPLRLSGLDDTSVREVTLAPVISGSVDYDDPDGNRCRTDFACEQQLHFASLRAGITQNPFVPGKPLEPNSPLFIGRGSAFRFLRAALHGAYQENVVALIGPRRIGKTSILRQAEARLSDLYWPVFVDVQGLLVNDIGALFRILAARCREAVGAAVTVPDAREFAADPGALPRFLRQLMRKAPGEKRLLIMLDEFDDLEHKVRSGLLPQDTFTYLRHLIQHAPGIAFLLSGTNRLEELAQDYWSFLFNLAVYRRVGRLGCNTTCRALTEILAQLGIACDPLTAYRMWELTGGHPYFLQLVGHYLVGRCQRAATPALTCETVDTCVSEMLEWGDTHLGYLWELVDPLEQAVLVVVQGQGANGVTAAGISDVLRRHACHLSPAAIAAALDGLVAKDLATAVAATAPRYRLTMGILGAWIAANQSLPRAIRRAMDATRA